MTAEQTPDDARLLELPSIAFDRLDEAPDRFFYAFPRLVTHIDDEAIAAVTRLYRGLFPAGGAILDLMSSWVSHLPAEAEYRRVVGLGLNREELAANPRLDELVVQDLNERPELPFDAAEFDGAAICVSIQYLRHPIAVLRDVARVLRVGAPLVVTFSNRCFPTKAVRIWRMLDDAGHVRLVERYLQVAGGWSRVEHLESGERGGPGDPLFAVVARRADESA
jgi:SAM-dependent methyltransferase